MPEHCARTLFQGIEKINVEDVTGGSGSKQVDSQEEIDPVMACLVADAVYQKQGSTNQKKNMISAKFELTAINKQGNKGVVIWTALSNMHKETQKPYLTTRVAYLDKASNDAWSIKNGFEFQHSEISDPAKETKIEKIFLDTLQFAKLCKVKNGNDACGDFKDTDMDRKVSMRWWVAGQGDEGVLDKFGISNDNKKAVFFGTELSTTNKEKATLKKIYETSDKKWKSGYTLSWNNDVKSPIKKDSKGIWSPFNHATSPNKKTDKKAT